MNVRQFLSAKKKILIPLFIILILMAGGFFYWWQYYETPPEKWGEADYSKPEDYVVVETPEGIMVVNKKVGLSFKLPEEWRVEKPEYPAGQIRFYSEDAEEKSLAVMERGCRVIPMVTYVKISLEAIESNLKKAHKKIDWLSMDEYEIIEVGGYKGLKNALEDPTKFNIYHVGIYIPTRNLLSNKLYSFELTAGLSDKEECSKELENFLKTVLIE